MPDDTVRLPLSQIVIAAERFQFKSNVDEGGVTNELKGVTRWEPDAEGVSSVWRDKKARRTYMVNGHHRYELALRLGQPDLRCRYLDAATETEARTRGSLINIREGRGTPIDAAKVFRDAHLTPAELDAQGISTVRGTLARDSLALASLHPTVFYWVVIGKVPMARGIVIGRELPAHTDQLGLMELLKAAEARRDHLTDAELVELIRHVRASGTVQVEQQTLFGPELLTNSLAVPKARISCYVRSQLISEKRTFGFVSTSLRANALERGGNKIAIQDNRSRAVTAAQLLELYEKLAIYKGPIADALNAGARLLANGEDEAQVKRDTLRSVAQALSAELSTLATLPTVIQRGGCFAVQAA